VFGRQKTPVTPSSPAPSDELPPVGIIEGKKGRPTPRRKEAEAANRRPLVPDDRRAAAKTAKQAAREQRDREYDALKRGDESRMPLRDRGPVRRFVRDWVDARRNLTDVFLPVVLVLFVAQVMTMSVNAYVSLTVLALLWLYTLATIIDSVVLWFRLKKRVLAKFGELPRGTLMYGLLRAYQLRRSRLPRPTVKRGEYPQ